MPQLSNPKHEIFAREIAKGKTGDQAYVIAGYKENRKNASRLRRNEDILRRIAELQERAAAKAEKTLSDILDDLERLAEKAEGENTSAGFNVARGCKMDYAKLRGWNIDRKEVGQPGDFANMSDADLKEFVLAESETLVAKKGLH